MNKINNDDASGGWFIFFGFSDKDWNLLEEGENSVDENWLTLNRITCQFYRLEELAILKLIFCCIAAQERLLQKSW